MNLTAEHYVYEWFRPDYDMVFYVGKGKGNRAHAFRRNKHTNDVISYLTKNGMKPCVRIVARFVNEDSAYEFEEERVAYWGLENLTNDLPGGRNGGGGMTGKKHRPDTIDRIKAANKKKVVSLETRRKIKIARAKQVITEETRLKMAAAKVGVTFSAETCKKISIAVKAAKNTPEGKLASIETGRKISAIPGVKEKRVATRRATLRSRPNHWSNVLSEQDIWDVGTLLTSKENLKKIYGISITAIEEIRKIIEQKLGVGPRRNLGSLGKKFSTDAIAKCKSAKQSYWDNLPENERKDLGRRMSEGRQRAKENKSKE